MLTAMQWVFEDSEVAACSVSPGTAAVLTVRFSAARVYAEEGGKTGSGEGLWLPMRLACTLSGPLPPVQALFGKLEGGRVLLEGQRLSALPVPCALQQPLVLELEFASGAQLRVAAHGLEVLPEAPHCATGAFQC
jgi:hypothetical protein